MNSVRITLPSNPDLYVEVKSKWSWGDSKAMELARSSAPNDGEANIAFAQKVLERCIVRWNLTDPSGHELPITPDNIDNELVDLDAQAIILRCVEVRAEVLAPVSSPN